MRNKEMSAMEGRRNEKFALIPRLRFPKFHEADEWEIKPLSATARITQGGTPSTSVSEYWGGEVQWITPAEMGKDVSPYISKTVRTITNEGLLNCSSDLLPPYSVILSTRAPIGHLSINTKPMAINQGCRGIVAHSDFSSKFIYFLLGYSRSRLESLGAGNTFKELSGSALKSFTIPFPSTVEQQKIADCLSSIDELISAEARKLDALKAHKKGLMQQLFPTEGETVPRLRFPEFQNSGEWEVKKLNSFCKVGDIDHKMPSTVTDGIPYIMTGDFYEVNNIDFKNAKKISTEDYKKLSRKIKPEFGDIIVARYASVGAVRYVETDINFLVSYSCAIIKCDKSENSKYLYYIFQSDVIQSKIGLEINMSSQKNIGIDSINGLDIFLPTLPEQQKIADYLGALDALIIAETQKLEVLKTHKKGLMQQLFPVMDEV